MEPVLALTHSLPSLSPHTTRVTTITASSTETTEIRVCTNRTCRKQGSLQTFETLSGVSPANVTVKTCGCLGRCGSGPNLAVLPQGIIVSHCGTARRAARIVCGDDDDVVSRSLEALALRKRAENELDRGSFSEAETLLTQAINLKPFGGIHILYKDRSVARLALSKYKDALEDAQAASAVAPRYSEAYICEGDTFMEMGQFDEAEKSYSMSLNLDPSLRRSGSFKVVPREAPENSSASKNSVPARIEKLQEKLITVNAQ